ncbi:hypothetical protein MPSEU_000458400 [Mayamaea pseudoterrestris]|nr:hypothetical protein MPSEU_000458400 [Mayamaea pseudoterrestris]
MASTTINTGVIHSNAHIHKDELLAKIGGEATLHKAVDIFYSRLLQDAELQPFFQHANMTILKWHQFNIMSIAFTQVPNNVDIRRLILSKHVGLFEDCGLTAHHYDIVCRHFEETLQDLHVDPVAIAQAKSVVVPLRDVFAEGAVNCVQQRVYAQQRKRSMIALATTSLVVLGAMQLLRWRRTL